ncbi:putative leucine-rich repeat-containing protein DDB_G0290503 [Ptychodera flava]|uniref:putative leucine-rich repeat-containing protein DDB_G0290503 n=1 Tax=Ptychodera flava TaxID=63121 RepID=UPI00396A54BD
MKTDTRTVTMATSDALVSDTLDKPNDSKVDHVPFNGCGLDDENVNLESDHGNVIDKDGCREPAKTLSSSLNDSIDSLEKIGTNDLNQGVSDVSVSVSPADGFHVSEAWSGDHNNVDCQNDHIDYEDSVDPEQNDAVDSESHIIDACIQTEFQRLAVETVMTSTKASQMPSLSATPEASPAHRQRSERHRSQESLTAVFKSDREQTAYQKTADENGIFYGMESVSKRSNGGVKFRRYSANDDRSKSLKQHAFECKETKSHKNYHKDCVPNDDGKTQKPVFRKSKVQSPRPNYLEAGQASHSNGGSSEMLSSGSDSSGTVKSQDGKPDWVMFEKDEEKLTNAQKSLIVKKQFAALHYKFGLNTPGKGELRKKDSDSIITIRSPTEKQNNMKISKTPNGRGIKRDSPTDASKLKFTYEVEPSPYSATPAEKYLTPLQQKERQVKELNRQVRELQQLVRERDIEIQYLTEEMQQQVEFLTIEKDHTITEMQELHDYDLGQLKEKHAEDTAKLQDEIQNANDDKNTILGKQEKTEQIITENKNTIAELEATIAQMKKEYEDREQVHRDRYLEMYRKGQLAQELEMEENMVLEAAKNPQNKAYKGLLKKLDKTEEELEKLKETRRHEIYSQGWQINSDPEAIIQLLRSTIYYYLIDREPMANLRALFSILDYTEVQRRAMVEALKKKRK